MRDGDRELRLGGPKQRGLLALLLLRANEVVSADRLLDELWDGAPPDEQALHPHVSRLRKVLEPEGGREVLVTRSPGYALRLEADQLDLLRFEALVIQARTELDDGRAAAAAARLREALGLWRLQEQILTQDPALDHERPPRAAAPRERMGVLLVAAAAAAAVVAIALTGGDDDAPVEPSGGNVAVIDADTGQTRTRVAAGGTPSTIALGAGAAWVVDADAQTVSRIDLRSRAVTTFATGATPTDVAVGRAEYGSAAAAP